MKIISRNKGVFPLLKLFGFSTLLALFFIIYQPNPFDIIFYLFLEVLSLVCLMVIFNFFTTKLITFAIGILQSVILIPIVILFLWFGLIMVTLMFIAGTTVNEEESSYALANYSHQLLGGDYQESIVNIFHYFGDSFYWLIGGFLLYHFVFQCVEYANGKKKGSKGSFADLIMVNVLIHAALICLLSMIIAIPMLLIMLVFNDKAWPGYIIVILFRLGMDAWYNSMKEKKEDKSESNL